jgi:hypothetical protein
VVNSETHLMSPSLQTHKKVVTLTQTVTEFKDKTVDELKQLKDTVAKGVCCLFVSSRFCWFYATFRLNSFVCLCLLT